MSALFERKRSVDHRKKVYGVRLSEREIYVLKRYARKHKLTPSDFVRKAIKVLVRASKQKPV
jgi:predicted mannosyl-3-phosphoglycerate phosphatase (HAD superfamily)